MPVLHSAYLVERGPGVAFAALPECLWISESQWPCQKLYLEYVFFDFSAWLLEITCELTHSYLFFDEYAFFQYTHEGQIYSMAGQFLLLANRIAICPEYYFEKKLSIYDKSLAQEANRTAKHLKSDLLETLTFLSEKLRKTALEGKCLAVVGY